MRKPFWSCWLATRPDRVFERYEELEAGLKAYREAELTMPSFQGLIVKSKDGAYGVEKLLSFGTRPKKTNASDVDWG
jgi:hypothetical protein